MHQYLTDDQKLICDFISFSLELQVRRTVGA